MISIKDSTQGSRVFNPALLVLAGLLSHSLTSAVAGALPGWVELERTGSVNRVAVRAGNEVVGFYRLPEGVEAKAAQVFVSHHRRDLLEPVREDADKGAAIHAPGLQKELIAEPEAHWDAFWKKRFHYYDQQSTRILSQALPVKQWLSDGEKVIVNGSTVGVVATPGYTRDSLTFWMEREGSKVAFTGDLILAGGKVPDLYSLQDAIPDARIRGYHGYAARLADLVASLEKIQSMDFDVLVPARGRIITEPGREIAMLLERVRAVYRNYLSTSALHWYFKEDRMKICAERVLGEGADFELMPYSRHDPMPEWIIAHATSRLLVSETGAGFLIDCGYPKILDFVKQQMEAGIVDRVEGIFATHIHDDHTNQLEAASKAFGCPVYTLEEYGDVIANPGSWFLPGLTENGVSNMQVMKDGDTIDWHGFSLQFRFFPAQTYYHGALLAVPKGRKGVLFVGDGFTPSGMDDYCLLNRNLMDEDTGYFKCMEIIGEVQEQGHGLMNQHVTHVFYYTRVQLDELIQKYRKRAGEIAGLTPWPHVDFALDEQWAWFHPYGQTVSADRELKLNLRVSNHAAEPTEARFRLHLPDGWSAEGSEGRMKIPGRSEHVFGVTVTVPEGHDWKRETELVTADVTMGDKELAHWAEALVRKPE